MNSRFLNAAGWDADVAKMINAYGAPISNRRGGHQDDRRLSEGELRIVIFWITRSPIALAAALRLSVVRRGALAGPVLAAAKGQEAALDTYLVIAFC
jgi:hypothetical protein